MQVRSKLPLLPDPREPYAFSHLFPGPVGTAMVQLSDSIFPLFPEEETATAKAVAKRRIEFSAGRHCARLAMAQLGYPACSVPSGSDRAPVWPHTLVGSITHNANYCAAVVAPDQHFRSVGIDMEAINAVPEELMDQVLRPEEIARLDSYPRPNGADWLTLHFCLKEAAYKAFYPITRRVVDFQEMRVSVDPEEKVFFARTQTIRSCFDYLFQGKYLITDEYIIAACWFYSKSRKKSKDILQYTENIGSIVL